MPSSSFLINEKFQSYAYSFDSIFGRILLLLALSLLLTHCILTGPKREVAPTSSKNFPFFLSCLDAEFPFLSCLDAEL